jgi:hypothetical protein
LLFLFAYISEGSGEASPNDLKRLSDLRKEFGEARDPKAAADAFEALIDRVGAKGLPDLKCDDDTSIALQAAWREVEERTQAGASSFNPADLQRFLGFMEGRARSKIPSWWEQSLTGGVIHRPHVVYFAPSGQFGYRETAHDIFVPDGISLSRDDEWGVIKDKDRKVTFPIDIMLKKASKGDDHLSISIGEERAYIALHDYSGFSYCLFCIQGKPGSIRWTAHVWGSGRRLLAGVGRQDVSVVEQDTCVVVFGQEAHGMYAEGFEPATGKCLFRFRTSLPFGEKKPSSK